MAVLAAITINGCTPESAPDAREESRNETQLKTMPEALNQPPTLTLNGNPVAPYLVDWASPTGTIHTDATGHAVPALKASGDLEFSVGSSAEPASVEVVAYSGHSTDIDPMSEPTLRWDCGTTNGTGCTYSLKGETLQIIIDGDSVPAAQSVVGINLEYFASPELNKSRFANVASWVMDIEVAP
ncbi:hypothetical protein [Arthrobacter sp. 31Y]|uniref:hypothetical protein n=1 Tax=Arthrobacter sp. 31Y TaxID=1115632 RepID=UPI000465885F|nr:hypothetical protein [Arthrobacter sp. 31Y]